MLYALDFESEAIDNRPKYPPKPVGLAWAYRTETLITTGSYMAWGHPTENNSSQEDAVFLLESLFDDPDTEFVFHNAPFDCSIIEERLELKVPWNRVHDTMLMAFLHDPYGELALKPLAQKLLNIAPDERDAVRDWLVRKGFCRPNAKDWGAFISKAPGNLDGKYASGDVTRTLDLYYFLKAKLEARGMV